MSISVAKWTVLFLFCASRITFLLPFTLVSRIASKLFELLPFFVHCCFRIPNFHRLGHKNKIAHQIVMCHRVISFACDVIFVIFRKTRFQTLSRRFMSLHDACISLFSGFCWILWFRCLFPAACWDAWLSSGCKA